MAWCLRLELPHEFEFDLQVNDLMIRWIKIIFFYLTTDNSWETCIYRVAFFCNFYFYFIACIVGWLFFPLIFVVAPAFLSVKLRWNPIRRYDVAAPDIDYCLLAGDEDIGDLRNWFIGLCFYIEIIFHRLLISQESQETRNQSSSKPAQWLIFISTSSA